jgi:hypothetical protein
MILLLRLVMRYNHFSFNQIKLQKTVVLCQQVILKRYGDHQRLDGCKNILRTNVNGGLSLVVKGDGLSL